MTPARARLPNRRPAVTQDIEVGGHRFTASVGFDEHDRAKEVFLSGAKDGTDLAAILDDASVVLSVALQFGIPAAALARSVARLPACRWRRPTWTSRVTAGRSGRRRRALLTCRRRAGRN